MRKIQFRAWDKKRKQMIYDFDQNLEEKGYKIEVGDSIHRIVYGIGLIYRTLMQFTGFKDKKKKEVYEGDIVKGSSFYGVVKWINFSWQVHRLDADGEVEEWFIINDYEFEVIGNIYEDSDMLKRVLIPHP